MPWQADTIDSTDEPTGCDIEKFTWCTDLKQVNVWFYYGCYILFIGLSIPILTISMTTLFSQILGPRRQGINQIRKMGPAFYPLILIIRFRHPAGNTSGFWRDGADDWTCFYEVTFFYLLSHK
jgi:hypothetical protein